MTRFQSIFNLSMCAALLSLIVAVQPGMAQVTVSAWGRNANGQLGIGSYVDSNTPVALSGLTGVVAIAGGDSYTVAMLRDGAVWAWGANDRGQLGNGTNTDSNTPVPVSGLTDAVAICAGGHHSLALKRDHTIMAWGSNNYGELGNGINTDSTTPVAVSNLVGVTAIACGYWHSLAVNGDRTVSAWGLNNYGQLGNGMNTDSNTPVAVSGLTDVIGISSSSGFSVALRNDGTVRAWGYNEDGEVGNGTMGGGAYVPVAVSGLSGVVAIATGYLHSLALKSDGKVWAWGWNEIFLLGNGYPTSTHTPVPVSTMTGLTNVIAIAGGYLHSLALKSDGTIMTWGHNDDGQLGDCTNTSRTTPVAVRRVTGVTTIAGGRNHSLALGNTPPIGACSNQPPVALCMNRTVSAGPTCKASASVNNGSNDPDGDTTTLSQSPAGPYGPGATLVTLTVTDSFGSSSTCQATVTVVDSTPPSISSSVAQTSLWPANHDLVNVGLTLSASDNCKASPLIGVSVFSNESDTEETGEGNFSPDAKGLAPGTLRLRSERKGDGAGRVYLIAGKADDGSGNVAFSCPTVVVPHSQSKADQAAIDSAAAAARVFCLAHSGAPPAGYVQVGIGTTIGPKQ